jgi:hypothetical protein
MIMHLERPCNQSPAKKIISIKGQYWLPLLTSDTCASMHPLFQKILFFYQQLLVQMMPIMLILDALPETIHVTKKKRPQHFLSSSSLSTVMIPKTKFVTMRLILIHKGALLPKVLVTMILSSHRCTCLQESHTDMVHVKIAG